jgi:hypothetical protein
MSEQLQSAAGEKPLQVSLSGYDLINSPRLNKGTAFSDHQATYLTFTACLPRMSGLLTSRSSVGCGAWTADVRPRRDFLVTKLANTRADPTTNIERRWPDWPNTGSAASDRSLQKQRGRDERDGGAIPFATASVGIFRVRSWSADGDAGSGYCSLDLL